MADVTTVIDAEFAGELHSLYRYEGFNAMVTRELALDTMGTKLSIEIAVLGAMRGSNLEKIGNIKPPSSDSTIARMVGRELTTSKKKEEDLTILRVAAAFAPEAAYTMSLMDILPRIQSELPACLQFPAAGGIPLTRKGRALHIDFSKKFSELLPSGSFDSNIYMSMANSVVDSECNSLLHGLFPDIVASDVESNHVPSVSDLQ